MISVPWPQALAWRMRRQLLDPVGSTAADGVVGALGAVAAQLDPTASELGIRTRQQSSGPGDVARALDEGRLIKTFAFRGATHLMTPEQAGVHLALRLSSRMWERPGWQSFYELGPRDWPALREAVREALADGPMTRAELAAAVTAHPRFAHLTSAFTDPSATFLKPLAWHGDVCLAPPRDRHMTVQRLDANPRWAGVPELDDAGPLAIEAYLRAYGPASPENLHYWLGEGLGVRRGLIRRWLDGLGDRLATVEVDGEPRWVLHEDADELAATPPTGAVRLLPKYDQWVLGPGTADTHVVPSSLRSEVSRGANLVVVGGVVAGTWSLAGDRVVTSWAAGGTLPTEGDLDGEVERLAGLVGTPLGRPR